jgi:hypothetical protein
MNFFGDVPDWPPEEKIDRTRWIYDTRFPILPPGSESRIALARMEYPLVYLRIPIMGPKYMKAISILSKPSEVVESTSWFMPDIGETVNFDHNIAIQSS